MDEGGFAASHVAARRDVCRRPAFFVGAVSLAAVLAVIPRLGNPAAGVRDNTALAVELALSTLAMAGTTIGGILAIRVTERRASHGISTEMVGAPTQAASLVLGRAAGACTATLLLLGLALALGSLGWVGAAGTDSAAVRDALWVGVPSIASATVLATAMATAIGLVLPFEAATIAFIALAVALRLVPGAPSGGFGPLVLCLPNPSRLDLAREIAFQRPVGAMSIAALHATAWLQVAALATIVARAAAGRVRRGIA